MCLQQFCDFLKTINYRKSYSKAISNTEISNICILLLHKDELHLQKIRIKADD